MTLISVTYNTEWQLKNKPHIQFTKCGKCFNVKSGKPLKKCMVGYSVGYYISGKFIA